MSDITHVSDEEVVEIVRSKNKEAYKEIMRRYSKKLMRYIMYMTQDYDGASDIVQEAFIKAYTNLQGFNPKKKFNSWLYRIAHNEAINFFNRHKRYVSFDEKVNVTSGELVEDNFVKKELKRHTDYCLSKMPMIYREPLSLFFLEEKSYDEISDILRIPVGTVGTRINRAKRLMKNICEKNI